MIFRKIFFLYSCWLICSSGWAQSRDQVRHFDAECQGDEVTLSWQTYHEDKILKYEILRSVNGNVWNKMKTIDARGQGDTTTNYEISVVADNATMYYQLHTIEEGNRVREWEGKRVSCINMKNYIRTEFLPDRKMYRITITSQKDFYGELIVLNPQNNHLLTSYNLPILKGKNQFIFDLKEFNLGLYQVEIKGNMGFKPAKLVILE